MIRLAIRFNDGNINDTPFYFDINDTPAYFNVSTYGSLFKKHYEERDYFVAYLMLSQFISYDGGRIHCHFPYVNCINTRTRYMK